MELILQMKPLRIEINIVADEDSSVAGVGVYNEYKGGKPIHERIINCNNSDPTEVMAYVLKKYVINKNLKWDKVTYNKTDGTIILLGVDNRK